MERLHAQDIRSILAGIARIMTERREELIRLDGTMGDGDLGLTMEKGFAAAREEAEKGEETDAGKLLLRAGMAIARAAPSTMGTLVATGFMAGGKAVSGRDVLDGTDLAAFFNAFSAGVMQRGKSKPGEKTVVDVLEPASRLFSEAAASGVPLEEAVLRLQEGARQGREACRQMIAQHGRLAYYQEKSQGQDDPGAVAVTYILQGFVDYIRGQG